MAICVDRFWPWIRARGRRANRCALVATLCFVAIALHCRENNDNSRRKADVKEPKALTVVSENREDEHPVIGLFIVVDLDSIDDQLWNQTADASLRLSTQQCIQHVRVYLLLLANNFTNFAGRRCRLVVGHHVMQRFGVCAQSDGGNNRSTEHVVKEVLATGVYLETLNLLMIDAYASDNVDYFYVAYNVFRPTHLTLFDSNPTSIRYLAKLSYVLQNDMHLSNAGVITGSRKLSHFLFFSRTQFHIFGLFFPLAFSRLPEAANFVLDLYRRVDLTRSVSVTGSDVTLISDTRDNGGRDVIMSAKRWPKVFHEEFQTLQRYITVAKKSRCLYCSVASAAGQLRVISMSLYGSDRQYTVGALRNAQLAPVIFPGWQIRFYCKAPGGWQKSRFREVPTGVVSRLRQLGAEVRYVDAAGSHLAPMSWRFTVIDDPQVYLFIVRDADSRLTPRDAAAVSDWLRQKPETAAMFHCIRDHPAHADSFINGGLWGARREELYERFNGSFVRMLQRYSGRYNDDVLFLDRRVWPLVRRVAYCHDSVACRKFPASFPFPVERRGGEHVGQRFDELSRGNGGDMHELATSRVDRRCVVTVTNLLSTTEGAVRGE